MRTSLLSQDALNTLRDEVKKLPHRGKVLCAGVYQGGDIVEMFNSRPDLTFYAIDSFEGISEPGDADGTHARKGMFNSSVMAFQRNTDGLPVVCAKAWITYDSIERLYGELLFDMVWADLDLYEPTKAVLEFAANESVYHVLVHDYTNENWPGVRNACDAVATWTELPGLIGRLEDWK